jgi:hypothetical protein
MPPSSRRRVQTLSQRSGGQWQTLGSVVRVALSRNASLKWASGIPCREGAFTEAETDCIRTAIRAYQEVSNSLIVHSASYQLVEGPEFERGGSPRYYIRCEEAAGILGRPQ